jgi:hypothetical protein
MTEHAQTSDRRWVDLLEREVGTNWPAIRKARTTTDEKRSELRAAFEGKMPPIPVSLFSAR